MIAIAPIQDLIVVSTSTDDRKLASGLIIPHVNDPERQTADDRDIGLVLAVGKGKKISATERRPMTVKVGDRVIFGRNKGQTVRYAEQTYCLLREEHVLGRLSGDGFEPLADYIVAELVAKEEVTPEGVIVPEFADDRDEALVLSVGPGRINDDGSVDIPDVQPGDCVLFNPRMAEPFQHGGKDYLALRQDHIVAISNRGPVSLAAD